MPKPPLITRWIAGVAVAAILVLGIAAMWQTGIGGEWPPSGAAAGEPSDIGRRQQELRFLKGAFDRLEAEAKQNPNSPALRSLRTEQAAVLERMREVARPIPRERVPNDLQALLSGTPAAIAASPEKSAKDEMPPISRQSSPAPPANAVANTAMPGELKPGLASGSPAPNLVLSRDPALNGVVLIARPRPPRPAPAPAPETTAEKPADRQPANANGTGVAEAKPPAKTQATVRAPERTAPPAANGATERPASAPVAILGR